MNKFKAARNGLVGLATSPPPFLKMRSDILGRKTLEFSKFWFCRSENVWDWTCNVVFEFMTIKSQIIVCWV